MASSSSSSSSQEQQQRHEHEHEHGEHGHGDLRVARVSGVDLAVELWWDVLEEGREVDLDLSALVFDEFGALTDACFFNQLSACGGALRHAGDSKDGAEDGVPDEAIAVDIDALDSDASLAGGSADFIVFVVNAHTRGKTFADVETATYSVAAGAAGQMGQMGQMGAGGAAAGGGRRDSGFALADGPKSSATGVVLCALFRDPQPQQQPQQPPQWLLRRFDAVCAGHNFEESLADVRRIALSGLLDPDLAAEAPGGTGRELAFGKCFDMSKGDCITIPPHLFQGGDDIFVGLGWDCDGSVDLDASVLMFDGPDGGQGIAMVYYGNLNFAGAVEHKGDNMTGAGDGDDEQIMIDLDAMPDSVRSAFITVNVYSSRASFASVHNAYVRVVAVKNGEELARFKLSDDIQTQGVVFAKLRRAPSFDGVSKVWQLVSLGEGCGGNVASYEVVQKAIDPEFKRQQAEEKRRRAAELEAQARQHKVFHGLITVEKARGLAAFDRNGKSDPYVRVTNGGWDKERKTKVHKKTLEPEWNEDFAVKSTMAGVISLKVYDHDRFSRDDFMGEVKIAWQDYIDKDTLATRTLDAWLPLENGQGEIKVVFKPSV